MESTAYRDPLDVAENGLQFRNGLKPVKSRVGAHDVPPIIALRTKPLAIVGNHELATRVLPCPCYHALVSVDAEDPTGRPDLPANLFGQLARATSQIHEMCAVKLPVFLKLANKFPAVAQLVVPLKTPVVIR